MNHLPLIKKRYWRIFVNFDRFEFNGYIACYVECKINRKISKPRGWFQMKEFTFNWNSLHVSKKDFSEIPNYKPNKWSHPFIEIFKDFWIEPIEYYEPFI